MNCLPIEICYHIFQYLHLNDLRSFRLICKRFKEMLYGFTIKELNIDHPNYRNLSNWIFINQPVNPLYSTNQDNLVFSKIITSSLFNFKLKRLRIINFNECLRLNLAILNKFHRLEQLEANLKVFRINVHVYNNIPNQIQIDTPNLSVLDLDWDDIFKNCYEYIQFLHPLSIQYLFINSYWDYLLIFKNIKYLQCKRMDNLDWKALSNHSQIQELHVEVNYSNLNLTHELKENPLLNS